MPNANCGSDCPTWLPVVPGVPQSAGARLRACVTAMLTEGYGLGTGTPLGRELAAGLG